MQPEPSQPPDEQATQPFNLDALARFRATANDVLAAHPEIRSAVVVLDFRGELNNAAIDRAIWLGSDGKSHTAEGVFGSIHAMMAVLDVMYTHLAQLEKSMRDRMLVMAQEAQKINHARQNPASIQTADAQAAPAARPHDQPRPDVGLT